jgi:hypothetical protein
MLSFLTIMDDRCGFTADSLFYFQGHIGLYKRNERAIRELLQRRGVAGWNDAEVSANAEPSAESGEVSATESRSGLAS